MSDEKQMAPFKSIQPISKMPVPQMQNDDFELDEFEIPRAKLLQYTSEEVQSKEDRKEAGIYINSITKEPVGNIFIPIFKYVNFICWNPRKKDDPNYDPAFDLGALIFSSANRRDPRVLAGIAFGPNGEPPKVTKYINYFTYFIGQEMPLILSFSKTSYSAGKRLNTLVKFYGESKKRKYKLKINEAENAGTKYFVPDIVPSTLPLTAEEGALADQWYEEFSGKNLKVHTDSELSAEPVTNGEIPID